MIKSVPIFTTTAVFVVIAACLLSSNPCNGQFFDFLNPTIDIEIPQGKLRGSTSFARNGKKFLQFLNIPYAQPPVGSLRFEVSSLYHYYHYQSIYLLCCCLERLIKFNSDLFKGF